MTPIFLFGALRDPDLLGVVLARPVDPLLREPATVQDHAALSLEDVPVLVAAPGRQAQGVLLHRPTEADAARLAYFAGAGAGFEPVTVATAGGEVAARCCRGGGDAGQPAGDWDFAAWVRTRKAVAVEAAREYMDYFGRLSVEHAAALRREMGVRALQRVRALASEPMLGGLRTAFGAGDVEVLSLERCYTSFLAVRELKLRHRRFDGGWTGVMDRTVVVWGDAVSVLPYDPRRDEVLLIEQFRPAPAARGDRNPWCIEVVAGRLDRHEAPEETARREAVEEAGVVLGRITRIGSYYPSPGVVSEHVTAFVGEADLSGAGGNHGLAEEHEDIRSIVLSVDAAMAALAEGAITAGIALTSLLWLAAHRERLRAEWGAE